MGINSFSNVQASAMHTPKEDRLDRLENLVEKVISRLDATEEKKTRVICDHCKKPGHLKRNCFQLRKCFKCNEQGHIARNCPKTEAKFSKLH